MGKYINQTSKGVALGLHGKAGALKNDGAVKIATPTEFRANLVCVMDNGPFEAAAYIYSESELRAFTQPSDTRPKEWFEYEHAPNVAR